MITLTWGGATDTGLRRSHNEDRLLAQAPIFMVADGMGGHAAGEEASEIAIAEFSQLVGARVTHAEVLDTLKRANKVIVDAARLDEQRSGMGTTVAGLVLIEDGDNELWLVVNVGDSRVYRLAGGVLERLSKDHSEVQRLVDEGTITEAERREHPRGHVVTRVLGTDPPPEADCWLLWPVAGERFLLCSDGLTGELTDEEIRDRLLTVAGPEEAAGALIESALEAGAHDNVTVIVVDVLGESDTAVTMSGPITSPRPDADGGA